MYIHTLIMSFNDYYLVGNGVASGWNNNLNNPALFRDA